MANIAAIDGITGPGKRTTIILAEPTEITFRLGKKVIEIVGKDGNTGFYDMAQVEDIQVTSDGKDFTIAVISKVEGKVEDKDADQSAANKSAANKSAEAAASNSRAHG